MNVSQSLRYAGTLSVDRLDAQMLVLYVLGRGGHERAWLLAHDDAELTPHQQQQLEPALRRRLGGEPVAYITGRKEFFGLELAVDARVLVPRPDTETLVEWALQVLEPLPGARVVDLGTGSGAIALALKHARPDLQVMAVDASAAALDVAQGNARAHRLEVTFSCGSWLEGQDGSFHAIVSNPPYIAREDPHLGALQHEPQTALTSGADGLDAIRTIITQSVGHLLPGGWLLLEHGHDQAHAVCALLARAGFTDVQSRNDLASIARCSGGRLRPG